MALRKMTTFLICLLILMASCNHIYEPEKKRADHGSIAGSAESELLNQMTRDIFYQDSIIRAIHTELEQIDAMYIVYETGIENNKTQGNRANVILDRIRHLDKLLEDTRSDLKNAKLENQGLLDMLDRLRNELVQKENKIQDLESTVSQQAEIIVENNEKIDELQIARKRQQEEIQRMDEELRGMKAAAYNDLADLLFQVAHEMPEVRGIFTRRTKEEVEELQERLIRDAHRYFEEASHQGDSYARSRINELKDKYAFLP